VCVGEGEEERIMSGEQEKGGQGAAPGNRHSLSFESEMCVGRSCFDVRVVAG